MSEQLLFRDIYFSSIISFENLGKKYAEREKRGKEEIINKAKNLDKIVS